MKFLFLLMAAILNKGWGCQTQFWKEPPKGHPKLGLIWFSGFREEDLNVKAYDVRMPSDGKSSHRIVSHISQHIFIYLY